MITKLLRLVSNKKITSYVVCLNIERYCGKIKDNGVTYKVPVIKLEIDKNDEFVNNYIEQNNTNVGVVLLTASNLVYLPKLNTIGIGLYIKKKVLLNIAFDLNDELHRFYLAGLLISKSLLVVSNKNLESIMNINFSNDGSEFTNKANELLLIITEKIAIKNLKGNPKFKDFNKNQIAQFLKEHPNYLSEIYDEIRNTWIYTED
ncbi:hypothetical protein LNQ49_16910 [Flavobacterium sp. F-65]|jgi:hypothetical protein|uniref:Uncharacterized protein n=1 Tax=Flavobacterium pisciphilum TaxID=2893755 RepID=A0ABS8MZI1_9FLAO|nr:hypothetical protein [Flavobacterium sp. F-65]MCC9073260.1 hypothetical protein [Flavobacterium sp. F-65]